MDSKWISYVKSLGSQWESRGFLKGFYRSFYKDAMGIFCKDSMGFQ